jgi:EAL domain-containing protein (putative c-di-GMP-specific phosphodiesterase class I)
LFVRLSKDTAKDGSFLEWLENHVRASRAEPQRLCFQITEEVASTYIAQVKTLSAALRQKGFRFALDSFGSGRDSHGLLEAIPLDFVKIDGAIVQGLTGDPQLQQRVRLLVEQATKRLIQTIGERVEDANTMAVLWQLGIEFIQGYFVNAPEDVTMSGESASGRR